MPLALGVVGQLSLWSRRQEALGPRELTASSLPKKLHSHLHEGSSPDPQVPLTRQE